MIQMAEETAHPPTLCVVLCTLCNEYFPLTGEVDMCQNAATQAIGISEQYDLAHGKNLAYRAQSWCQNMSEHFEMLRAGERGQDVRKHLHDAHNGRRSSASGHAATHCNTPQDTAAHCSALQDADVHNGRRSSASDHAATHCNTLQHTTTHYNTLQHTATHRNTPQHTDMHNGRRSSTSEHPRLSRDNSWSGLNTSQNGSSSSLTSETNVFELYGGRFSNLLGLQVLAMRSEWQVHILNTQIHTHAHTHTHAHAQRQRHLHAHKVSSLLN